MASRRVIPLSEIMQYVEKLGSGDGVCRKAPNRNNGRGGANAQRWWIEYEDGYEDEYGYGYEDGDIAVTVMSCEK